MHAYACTEAAPVYVQKTAANALFGNETCAYVDVPPRLYVLQQTIVQQNACVATTNATACEQVFFGVLTKGMYAAMQTYANLALDKLAKRGQADGSISVVKVRTHAGSIAERDSMLLLEQCGSLLAPPPPSPPP